MMLDPNDIEACLQPTEFIDSDSPLVRAYADRIVADEEDPRERAVRLFYAVRDGLRYNPYSVSPERQAYRASHILGQKEGFCIPKAILLAAACRAIGVPARLRFADVRNHLTSPQLRRHMGTDVFVFHGYTELFLDDRWLKATPTFNIELCERFGVRPLDFDGRSDAIFHEFDTGGRRHMEYVRDRGAYVDLPFDEMITVLHRTYGGSPVTPGDGGHDPYFED